MVYSVNDWTKQTDLKRVDKTKLIQVRRLMRENVLFPQCITKWQNTRKEPPVITTGYLSASLARPWACR